MKKFDVVIKIYFSRELSKETISDMIEFSVTKSHNFFNNGMSHISYSLNDSYKSINKSVLFKEKNTQIFYDNLINNKVNSFEIFKLSDNFEYKSKDTDISFSYKKSYDQADFNSVMLQLRGDLIKGKIDNNGITKLISDLINILISENHEIKYGFIFSMDQDKFPKFFTDGIESENLTKQEEKMAFVWGNKQSNCDKKIWDIFWGNILTNNHFLDNITKEKICSLFGDNYITKLTDNVMICYLPDDILENPRIGIDSSNKKEKIINELLKKDLILKI